MALKTEVVEEIEEVEEIDEDEVEDEEEVSDSKKDVQIDDEEKLTYAEDMNAIIAFADTITKVNTLDIKAKEHLISVSNVFHDDEVIIHNVERDALLAASPTKIDGYITVPRVIEN